jgi:mRNA interferase MazF
MNKSEKDFFGWIEEKKRLHEKQKEVYFDEREIWWCALGVNIGFEQDGKGERYERPVVIIKKFNAHACAVVPLTARDKKGWYYLALGIIEGRNATAILSQVRFVDRRRLINKIGTLPESPFAELKKAVTDRLS